MTTKKVTRRDFIKAAGITLGAATLTCVGATAGVTALAGPQPENDIEVEFIEKSFGDQTMNKRVLVAYASRTGSTSGVAEAIGKSLAEGGAYVDVRQVTSITDISSYDAVVVGSAIQGSKWLPEAVQFVQDHQEELRRVPFAAFLLCMTLAMKKGDYRAGVSAWLDPVRAMVRPVSEGLFAGILDIRQVKSFSERLMFRASVMMGVWDEGDHRDWQAVQSWAKNLRGLILN